MKKFVLLIVGMCLAGALTGCETVKGIGQDIENTGNNIWEAVNR